MKESNVYSNLAIKAMERAAIAAMQKAADQKLEIPVWENGAVSFVNPRTILTKTSR